MSLPRKVLLDFQIGGIVKTQAKKNKSIIYGAQALKHQLFEPSARPTTDWDVLSNRPKRSAKQLERTLDKRAGYDAFYTKPAMHPGTHKVMDKGDDSRKGTKDDFGIADYTKMRSGLKTVSIKGVRFVHTSEVAKDKRRSLRDPEFVFRHPKDQDDLDRIKHSRNVKRMFNV